MFEPTKPFYMTRAIAEELSQEHQQFIVQYLFENHKQLNDYFQIFDFYIENDEQWLTQRQEEPHRESTIHIELSSANPIERKVWAIDQNSEGVMILFPEDY